jgi:hypothetical protein
MRKLIPQSTQLIDLPANSRASTRANLIGDLTDFQIPRIRDPFVTRIKGQLEPLPNLRYQCPTSFFDQWEQYRRLRAPKALVDQTSLVVDCRVGRMNPRDAVDLVL